MNITDLDDKIIMRARRNFLVEQYLGKEKSAKAVIAAIQAGFATDLKKQGDKVKAATEAFEACVKVRAFGLDRTSHLSLRQRPQTPRVRL
jgi:cysteinyl-tRNA synthetase